MKLTDNEYYVNRHSCFLSQYHLVLVTKYRHQVLTGVLDRRLQEYTKDYFKERGLTITSLETNLDHIHILFEAPPQLCLAEFVTALNSASSGRMRAEFSETLKPYYWKPYFWSLFYFVVTVSDRSTEAVRRYITNQKG